MKPTAKPPHGYENGTINIDLSNEHTYEEVPKAPNAASGSPASLHQIQDPPSNGKLSTSNSPFCYGNNDFSHHYENTTRFSIVLA